jgi:ribonuclease P protein component
MAAPSSASQKRASRKLGRLRKRSEFLAVAATNRRHTTPGLVLQARRAAEGSTGLAGEPALRLGFTATKKIGNAVLRNRARRRLRAAAREVMQGIEAQGIEARAADLVLVARAGTLVRDYGDLKQDLRAALARLGVAS